MEQQIYPVDVISICSADGQIRPLRLRMEDEDRKLLRVDIDEVIRRLEGIRCGAKITSCPDQLAQALKQYKAQQ